jgi:hypothetical protein
LGEDDEFSVYSGVAVDPGIGEKRAHVVAGGAGGELIKHVAEI